MSRAATSSSGGGGGGAGQPAASSSSSSTQPKASKRRSSSTGPTAGPSKAASRPTSSARTSPTTTVISGFAAPNRRPSTSQASKQPSCSRTSAFPSSSSTPSSSAASSRRSSVVLDTSAYRYSLNVGSMGRFPAGSGTGTQGAKEILRANKAAAGAGDVDPSRASVGSSTSSSRLSSRYMAEEVAPQRRPVYLALPSDPKAVGVWSSTTLAADSQDGKGQGKTAGKAGATAAGGRRNSKIMTSFPFPHPVTPRRRGNGETDGSHNAGVTGRGRGIGAAWQRLLTAIFAGPYERRLNREEQEDDRITQSIIHDIARRNGGTSYGTFPSSSSKPGTPDSDDPYGYRQLAGAHLLPGYTTDLVARRRERRRARSKARFECMASWTIWTVSALLVVIVLVLVVSFVFPDRLQIPNHSDEGDEDARDGDSLTAVLVGMVVKGVFP